MAVTFVAAGSFAGNATTASQAITAPACAANDILICAIINKSVTANAVSPPDGTWTAVITTEVNDCTTAADDHQYSVFWKRATGSGGSFTFTKAVDDNVLFGGVIVAYRGALLAGSPLDATAAARTETAGAADNVSFPAYNPVSTDNRVIFIAFYGNDLTTFAAAMSNDTNPDCTKDADVESSTGNDCSIAFTSGTNDGANVPSRTWASASTTDAGNTGVVFALVAMVDVPVNTGVGQVDVTGFAPTISISNNVIVSTALGQADVTGFAPTVVAGTVGTIYYVSNAGSDGAAGTSEGTSWQTINKVNGSSFSPGDQILFKRGDVWREQLTIPSSGSVGNPITFGAYGVSPYRPIINGADLETGWTNAGSNQWWINNPNPTTTRAMVFIGGVLFSEVASLAEVNSAGEYFIDVTASPDRLYVFSTVDPATLGAEISNREYCVLGSTSGNLRQYIKIENIEVRLAGNSGIRFDGPSPSGSYNGSCIVDGCYAYGNRLHSFVTSERHNNDTFKNSIAEYGGNGFYTWDGSNGLTVQNCISRNSIAHFVSPNNTDGGGIQNYRGTNWFVENCLSEDDADGIHVDAGGESTNCVIRFNRVFGATSDIGFGVGSVGAGAIVQIYYNLAVNCADSNIGAFSTMDGRIEVYNNTFYNNDATGIAEATVYLAANGANWVFKNNLIVRAFMASQKSNFIVGGGSMSVNNYNNYYIIDNTGNTLRNIFGSVYNSLAAWQSGVSQDANSISQDPLFIDVDGDNFSIGSTSPCINAGINVGLTRDINGNPITGTPDIGAFEFVVTAFTDTGLVTINGFAPKVNIGINTATGQVIVTGFAPTINITNNVVVSTATGDIVVTGFSPVLNSTINTGLGQVLCEGFASVLNSGINTNTGQVDVIGFAPVIDAGNDVTANTATGVADVIGFAPLLNSTINTNLGQVDITGFAPTVSVTNEVIVNTDTGLIIVTGFASVLDFKVNTSPGQLDVNGFAPVIDIGIFSGLGEVTITGYSPTISASGGTNVLTGVGEIIVTGFRPTIRRRRVRMIVGPPRGPGNGIRPSRLNEL